METAQALTATPTKTRTPTPTITATPMPTNTHTPVPPTATPTITMSPTPLPCWTPVNDNGTDVSGGVACFSPSQSSRLLDTSVFGMNLATVQSIADYSGTEASPVSIATQWRLTFYSGSVTFDTSATNPDLQKLNTEGILVVNGDLIMDSSCCQYNGLVFVTGNLTVADGDNIYGAVIMGKPYYHGTTPGQLTLTGSGANYARIIFQPAYLTLAQQQVAVYKEDISQRKSFQSVPNW